MREPVLPWHLVVGSLSPPWKDRCHHSRGEPASVAIFGSSALSVKPLGKRRLARSRHGGQPFVLRPELYDEKITTRKTGTILCLRYDHKIIRTKCFLGTTLPLNAKVRAKTCSLEAHRGLCADGACGYLISRCTQGLRSNIMNCGYTTAQLWLRG